MLATKSQAHLLAISKPSSVPVVVTDELVTRGNREVVHSVAANNGARFSDFGFLHMIKRSEGDFIFAEHVGLLKEIPRHMFQQLIAKASDDERREARAGASRFSGEDQNSVADVAGALHSKFGPASKSYFTAKRAPTTQYQYGNLNEDSILECARPDKIEETTVGLSLLCSLPVDVVERALVDTSGELTLILAKASISRGRPRWRRYFLVQKITASPSGDLDHMREEYARLNTETSRRFEPLRSCKSAAAADWTSAICLNSTLWANGVCLWRISLDAPLQPYCHRFRRGSTRQGATRIVFDPYPPRTPDC